MTGQEIETALNCIGTTFEERHRHTVVAVLTLQDKVAALGEVLKRISPSLGEKERKIIASFDQIEWEMAKIRQAREGIVP
jgi:hypothetical protein